MPAETHPATVEEREVVRAAARTHALDWYLAALLAPRAKRGDLVTIAAYLGEVARVPRIVSEPSLGLVRLQWWRDALASDAETGNPVADEMSRVARRLGISRGLLLRPLDGWTRALEEDGVPDEAALEACLDETAGTPFRLATIALGVSATSDLDALCRAAGQAWGRTRLALDLPRRPAGAKVPLPPSRRAERDPDAASAALAEEARGALHEARRSLAGAPKPAFTAFLPLALVEPYLRALEVRRADPLGEPATISPLARVSRLWLAKWRGSL